MYEDDPQETVFDVLGSAVFGAHPLGRAVIGRAPIIRDTPVEEIAKFHAERYVPSSVVLAAAGSVDHKEIVALAEETLQGVKPAPAHTSTIDPPQPNPTLRFQTKETEQCHICIGGLGLPRGDDRRFAANVLDAIFGGLTSSRLFQAIRETRGLAYAVHSFIGQYSDTGQVGLYIGTRPDNLPQAMDVIASELKRLRAEPATQEELERARENVKARIVMALEATGVRMNRLGSSVLFDLPLLEIDELMAKIDAVTIEDLAELSQLLWDPSRLSAAGIGPDKVVFHEAVSEICPAAG
jgi:predicted Zn-dependent peptidase